jgi:hypothetical protein
VTQSAHPGEFLIDDYSLEGFSLFFMATGHSVSTQEQLREAREEVVALLRAVEPSFLEKVPQSTLPEKTPEVAKAFLKWLSGTPFALEIVALNDGNPPMFEGRWTHNGAAFVGFKQPPAAANRDDAKILACAALLRNDWCRSRLPAV